MDLKKAFDKISRELLFRKLYNLGIRGKMFRVIRDIYSNNKAKVLIGSYLSPEFNIQSGVMQGSELGPLLFLIFIVGSCLQVDPIPPSFNWFSSPPPPPPPSSPPPLSQIVIFSLIMLLLPLCIFLGVFFDYTLRSVDHPNTRFNSVFQCGFFVFC